MSGDERLIGAVDIGGTKIAIGLVDERGRMVARADVATTPESSFDAAMDRVTGALSRMILESGAALEGIGIGATGPIDHVTGVFGCVPFFPHWEGGSPVRVLADAFGVRAAAENDADAGALGEAAWGAGRDRDRFIYVTVGTGIGGGIVLDGRLYRGAGGAHPELGHMVVDTAGPPCTCGGRGCWEALAAGPAIAGWLTAQAPARAPSPALTARDICDLARRGDALALQAVEREARYLGVGLANLITMFGPDVIALGGSVMSSYDLFAGAIDATVRTHCTLVPWTAETIRLAELGADAGLIGAAEVWRHRFGKRHRSS